MKTQHQMKSNIELKIKVTHIQLQSIRNRLAKGDRVFPDEVELLEKLAGKAVQDRDNTPSNKTRSRGSENQFSGQATILQNIIAKRGKGEILTETERMYLASGKVAPPTREAVSPGYVGQIASSESVQSPAPSEISIQNVHFSPEEERATIEVDYDQEIADILRDNPSLGGRVEDINTYLIDSGEPSTGKLSVHFVVRKIPPASASEDVNITLKDEGLRPANFRELLFYYLYKFRFKQLQPNQHLALIATGSTAFLGEQQVPYASLSNFGEGQEIDLDLGPDYFIGDTWVLAIDDSNSGKQ